MDIKQNASFMVDHRRFGEGFYISRIDGDITTFDMRTRKPNSDEFMDNVTMHSFEHMFSTYIRNSELDVLYFDPMGCQTGFYLLVRNADNDKVVSEVKTALSLIISHTGELFGASEIECGNYLSLSLSSAIAEAERYLEVLNSSPITYNYY